MSHWAIRVIGCHEPGEDEYPGRSRSSIERVRRSPIRIIVIPQRCEVGHNGTFWDTNGAVGRSEIIPHRFAKHANLRSDPWPLDGMAISGGSERRRARMNQQCWTLFRTESTHWRTIYLSILLTTVIYICSNLTTGGQRGLLRLLVQDGRTSFELSSGLSTPPLWRPSWDSAPLRLAIGERGEKAPELARI